MHLFSLFKLDIFKTLNRENRQTSHIYGKILSDIKIPFQFKTK